MRTHTGFSILAIGLLAMGCGGGAAYKGAAEQAGKPAARQAPESNGEAAPYADAPASDDSGFSAEGFGPTASAPAPAPRSAEPGRAGGVADEAPRARSEAKKSSSRPLDIETERPGLGTTWGETMTSHVSNSPFDRASSSPFSLTTIRYNDQSGIAAMLRGAEFADFRSHGTPAGNGMLTVRLTDANGSTLPTFSNQGRSLVQGEHGERYMIEITNQTASRFEAVVTVDGLDVIDGRPGSLAKRGYLVQAFATVQIDGFRQNMDQVAAFRFGSVRGSYAASKGSDRNVGVIGVAVFAERGAQRPWTEREINRRESADPFPGRFASPPIAR